LMTEFIYCPYCGAKNASTNKFCENCGQKLYEDTEINDQSFSETIPPYSNSVKPNSTVLQGNQGDYLSNRTQTDNCTYNPNYRPYVPVSGNTGTFNTMRTYQPHVDQSNERRFNTIKTIFTIIFILFFGLPILIAFLSIFLAPVLH